MAAAGLSREQHLARNEAILRAKVLVEMDKGARFLEQRVARMFPGLAGLFLNPLASLAFHAVGREEIVRRASAQADILLQAARDHGRRPEAVSDGHLTRYLQHDEAFARANRRHPRFPELEALVREIYVARVEPASMLLHRGMGETYNDLVRSVYPSKDHARRVVDREFLHGDRLFHLVREERDLLHAPPLVRREVFDVLRDTYDWYKATVHRNVDDVYADPLPATA